MDDATDAPSMDLTFHPTSESAQQALGGTFAREFANVWWAVEPGLEGFSTDKSLLRKSH